MPTVLITGANRGIGLELATAYAADGWTVIAAVRDPAKAGGLPQGVRVEAMDVGDDASIAAAAARLEGTAVDLLINNAGVSGPDFAEQVLGRINSEAWLQSLRINTISPAQVTAAFLPHLRKGTRPAVVTLSSVLGSMEANTDGGLYCYRSGKAGVNAVVRSMAADLRGDGIIVIAVHPGWVATDMGGPDAPVRPADSAAGLKRVLSGLTASDNGRFLTFEGQELPW